MYRALTFVAASACAALAITTAGFAATLPQIDFTLSPADAGQVQLRLQTSTPGRKGNSNWSRGHRLTDLPGLAPAQLNAARSTPVRFAVVREAGRIDCAGTAARGSGSGRCSLTPDAGFGGLLASRGIARPTIEQSYVLTMSGARRAQLDALAQANYPRPTLQQFTAVAIHGVDPAYIRGLADAGYRLGSVDDLVGFKIHQVSPDLIRAYRALGYRRLAARDLMAMAIHGVSPAFITSFANLGYRDLSADQLVKLRIFGVTPDDVRALQAQGIKTPSAEQLVRLRLAGFMPRPPRPPRAPRPGR